MAEETQAAVATKPSVRTWTEGEKDAVWQQALKAKTDGLPLTEAFRRCAKILPHRSEAAIGMLYYNVLRKEREEPEITPKKNRLISEFKVDPALLEAFQGLPEYMQELDNKLRSLEERVKQPDPISILRALGQTVKAIGDDKTASQIHDLKLENEELKKQIIKLEEDLKRLRQAYDDALGIYDMFTNMASISQIMSLGDFKQQMKTTLDKWGNVLDISFERQL